MNEIEQTPVDAGAMNNDVDAPAQQQKDASKAPQTASTPAPPPLGLAARIAAAMADVGSIAANGINPQQHYKFQRACDVVAAAQSAFVKEGIILWRQVRAEGPHHGSQGAATAIVTNRRARQCR